MAVKIYHNPRCSKSRQAVQLLQDKGLVFETILYLETGLQKDEIVNLLQMLKCSVFDIIREKEVEYKTHGLDKANVMYDDVVDALVKCPKLLERPIVINNNKAVIGRPIDNIEKILSISNS